MAGDLGIVIAFDQAKEFVKLSKKKLSELNHVIKTSDLEMSTTLQKYHITDKQQALNQALLRNSQRSQNNLTIEQNRLMNELARLNILQECYEKDIALISKLENIQSLLYTDDDLLGTPYDFYGVNWYLPEKFISLDILHKLMGWGKNDTNYSEWDEIFEHSENYHQSQHANLKLVERASGLFHSYLIDTLLYTESPRQLLLTELSKRIEYLRQRYVDPTPELTHTNSLISRNQSEIDAQVELQQQLKAKISNEQKLLASMAQAARKAQQCLIFNIYASKFVRHSLGFTYIVTLHQNWIDFLSKSEPVIDKNNISQTYTSICKYQTKLDAFIKTQKDILHQNQYWCHKRGLDLYEKEYFLTDDTYKPIFKLIGSVDAMLEEYQALEDKYAVLHNDYFEQHKALKVQEQACQDAQKLVVKTEPKKHEKRFGIYLGDGEQAGDLARYIQQRSETYWWYDLFTCFLSNCFFWAFGYVADKTIRNNFINLELRPALENYKLTGNNGVLASLLCSSNTPFFKPRTRESHSYCLTLDSMLNNIRRDFLSNEQLEAYKSADNTDQNTYSLL